MPTVQKGETSLGIYQKSGLKSVEEFLKLNPTFAAKGGPRDYQGLTGDLQIGQEYFLTPQVTPTKGSSTYIEDITKNFDDNKDNADQPVGTSDAERARLRQEKIDKIKAELEAGATKPTTYRSSDEFVRLRKEQGVVKDEEELVAIQNEARLGQQELRESEATSGEGVSEGGRLGMMSERERNLNFRIEGLGLRERAVIDRLNSKNAYISTVVGLGQQDYNSALQEYNTEYSKNVKAIELFNAEEDEQKKDALAAVSTISNLIKDKGITELTPALKAQLETSMIKSGLPMETVDLLLQPDSDKIVNTFSRDDGIFAVMQGDDGIPYVKQLSKATPVGDGLLSTGGALSNAFNSAILGLPATVQKQARATFNSYLSRGDEAGAKEYLLSVVTQGMPVDQQNQYIGRAVATDALKQIQGLLKDAREKGANTNLFTGNLEYTAQSLGTSTNPELAYIGSLLQQQFITYRRAMTGVAFSPTESGDYKKIFPNLIDVEKLSNAKIESLTDTFDLHNRAALSVFLGGTKNYDEIYGSSKLEFSGGVSPENKGTLDELYQQETQVQQPEKNIYKNIWNWLTSPFVPKF